MMKAGVSWVLSVKSMLLKICVSGDKIEKMKETNLSNILLHLSIRKLSRFLLGNILLRSKSLFNPSLGSLLFPDKKELS